MATAAAATCENWRLCCCCCWLCRQLSVPPLSKLPLDEDDEDDAEDDDDDEDDEDDEDDDDDDDEVDDDAGRAHIVRPVDSDRRAVDDAGAATDAAAVVGACSLPAVYNPKTVSTSARLFLAGGFACQDGV